MRVGYDIYKLRGGFKFINMKFYWREKFKEKIEEIVF